MNGTRRREILAFITGMSMLHVWPTTWPSVGGGGSGDMTKAVYDANNNTSVDKCETLNGTGDPGNSQVAVSPTGVVIDVDANASPEVLVSTSTVKLDPFGTSGGVDAAIHVDAARGGKIAGVWHDRCIAVGDNAGLNQFWICSDGTSLYVDVDDDEVKDAYEEYLDILTVVTAAPAAGDCDAAAEVGRRVLASDAALAAASAGLWLCTEDVANGIQWTRIGGP